MRKSSTSLAVIAAGGLCLVLVLLVWVALTGPGLLVTADRPTVDAQPSEAASASARPTSTPAEESPVEQSSRSGPAAGWFGEVLVVVALVVLGWAVWVWAPRMIDRLSVEYEAPPEIVEIEVSPERELGERIVSARGEHLAQLAEGSPRNGIVQCWMALQESAADRGLPPVETETPTEFLVRMLRRLDVDPRPAARLAELYHVARFSSHPLTEDDRSSARQALLDLHAELGVSRTAGNPGQTEGGA